MILVTGGSGFLGSTLIRILINAGKAVLATKRPSSVIPEKLRNSSLIEWVDIDVTDYFALSDIFPQITQVYHCAAKVSYQESDAKIMEQINIQGTQHIVNLCLEYRARLVHVSSIAALGQNKAGLPVSEADKWEYDKTMSNYTLSKYKSELEVWRGIQEGLDAVIVNPSVIMGADSGSKGSGAIFRLVNKGLKIYPPGSVGIVDVEDVAQIMIALMENKNITAERYILNSENVSNKELLQHIARLLQKDEPTIEAKPYILNLARRADAVKAFFYRSAPTLTKESVRAACAKLSYSNQKILETLDYQFKPLHKTLQEVVNTNYT